MDTGSNYSSELSLSEVHKCNGENKSGIKQKKKKNHKLKLEARVQRKREERKEECPVKKRRKKKKEKKKRKKEKKKEKKKPVIVLVEYQALLGSKYPMANCNNPL